MYKLLLALFLSGCVYVSSVPTSSSLLGLSKSQILKKYGGPIVRLDTDTSEVYLYQDFEIDRNKSKKIEFKHGKVISVKYIETFGDFKDAGKRWERIIEKYQNYERIKDTLDGSNGVKKYKAFKVQDMDVSCCYILNLKEKYIEVSEEIRKSQGVLQQTVITNDALKKKAPSNSPMISKSKAVEKTGRERIRQAKIKSRTTYIYDYSNGFSAKEGEKFEECNYDPFGRMTNLERKVNKSSLSSIFLYDDSDNLIEEIQYDDGKFQRRLVRSYDMRNNLLVWDCLNSDGYSMEKETYVYDNNDREVAMIYTSEGRSRKRLSKYNAQGDIILREQYNDKDKLVLSSSWVYMYNDQGQIAEEYCTTMQTSENYNNSSTNPSRTMYKYDDNGNRTEDIILDPISGSIIKRFIKVYDRQGNLIEQYMNNKNNGRVSYKYDRFGNILEEKDETFGPKITKYVYQYF